MWTIWRERNQRIFEGVEQTSAELKFFLHSLNDWVAAWSICSSVLWKNLLIDVICANHCRFPSILLVYRGRLLYFILNKILAYLIMFIAFITVVCKLHTTTFNEGDGRVLYFRICNMPWLPPSLTRKRFLYLKWMQLLCPPFFPLSCLWKLIPIWL